MSYDYELNYRRATHLLGELEDRLGYTPEFCTYEKQVQDAIDTGKNMSFVIESMSKKLDALAGEAFDEPCKCPHCGVIFEFTKGYPCCEDCTI